MNSRDVKPQTARDTSSSPGFGSPTGPSSSPGLTPTPSVDQGWQDIPLKCYSEQDIKDRRYHIAKFTNRNNVDILKDFTKPVRLHRKDPRNIQFHLSRKEIDQKKRQEQQKATEKAKRRQQRLAGIPVDDEEDDDEEEENKNGDREGTPGEADMSVVAPEGGARNFKRNPFKRKTRQINVMADHKRKLRYEEFYPWVMEDYDGKNVYVGNYEAGASEVSHVLFVFDKDGFKMIPAEKVYRFNPRNKYATLTLEEAEAKMEKKSAVPRWLMKHMSETDGEKDYRFRNNSAAPSTGPVAGPSNRMRTVSGAAQFNDRDSDHDDIDFEEEFADDEEAPIMDADEEENKLAEHKMKKEMLKAAHFDAGSDADEDDDLDDLFETEKSRKIDKEGKKLRKVLNKTEGGVYDSDEDENLNPYLSRSDLESDDSDDEIGVKQEPNEDGSLNDLPKAARQFFAHNVGDGFVVIKAPPKFLEGFPRGSWLPGGRKRPISKQSPEGTPQKKSKIESKERSASPTPPVSNMDLNDPGADGSLVTVKEVLDILKGNPLTTKELLLGLRSRVNANKENKQRIIMIVKKNLKLDNGKLVLRE